MKSTIASLVFLTALAVVVAADEAREAALYGEVFSKKVMLPHRTLELLKKLSEIYSGVADESTGGRKDRVAKLLEFGENDESKCNEQSFNQLQAQFEKYPYDTNVGQYLLAMKESLEHKCEDKFVDQIRRAFGDLTQELKANSEEMFEKIHEAFNQHWKIPEKHRPDLDNHIGVGLFQYLANRNQEQVNSLAKQGTKGRRLLLQSLFFKYIEPICEAYDKRWEPFRYFLTNDLHNILNHDLVSEYNGRSLRCLSIMGRKSQLVNEMAKQFSSDEIAKALKYVPKLPCLTCRYS